MSERRAILIRHTGFAAVEKCTSEAILKPVVRAGRILVAPHDRPGLTPRKYMTPGRITKPKPNQLWAAYP